MHPVFHPLSSSLLAGLGFWLIKISSWQTNVLSWLGGVFSWLTGVSSQLGEVSSGDAMCEVQQS